MGCFKYTVPFCKACSALEACALCKICSMYTFVVWLYCHSKDLLEMSFLGKKSTFNFISAVKMKRVVSDYGF